MTKELFKKLAELNNDGGIPFMEGRDKGGKLPLGELLTIDDYGFINGDDGPYAVISLKEYPKYFYFGSSVVTKKLQEVEEMFSPEDIKALVELGIPVLFEERTSKKGRTYINMVFCVDGE